MKVIIAGAGESGIYLAKMLYQAKKDIIIIDTDKDNLDYIDSHFDFLTIKGSASSIQVLKSAGIEKAGMFIAITRNEELNIMASILAKKFGVEKVIARINNKEYLDNGNEEYFKSLGIDSLIYPEILASNEVVSMLKQTGAIKSYVYGNGKISLFVIKIDKDAPIINQTLQHVTKEIGTFDFRAVAITRDGKTIIPKGYNAFHAGDLFYVITNEKGIDTLMKYSGKQNIPVKNIMIMGGSRIGQKIALMTEKKMYVKLVEIEKNKCNELAENLSNTLVINGDGRNSELIIEEGIENTDAFIAVTGNSETNILSCIQARKLGVKRTIAEIENIDYLPLAKNMGIDTIINKKLIAASHIYAHIMTEQVTTVQCLIETDAEVLEYIVSKNAKITKKTLKHTQFPKNAIIGGVIRGEEVFIAKGDTQLQENDKVILFALPKAIDKVSKLF